MTEYNPSNWFWVVGGNTSRAWSSASSAFVENYPEDRVTRIASEADLSEVLRPYGLRGPFTSPVDVKAEAQRRIITLTGTTSLIDCMIKQSNANMRANELNDKRIRGEILSDTETAEAQALRALAATIKAIRAKSNEIEAMSPIPSDLSNDGLWS